MLVRELTDPEKEYTRKALKNIRCVNCVKHEIYIPVIEDHGVKGVETTVQKQKRRPFSKKRNLESRDPVYNQDSEQAKGPREGYTNNYYILYITARGDRVFTEKVQPDPPCFEETRGYILPFFTYKL